LFEGEWTIGSPAVGYRIINGDTPTTEIFNEMFIDEGTSKCYLKGLSEDYGYLSDINGNPIEFDAESTDNPPEVIMNESNVNKLISGFPASEWRSKTKFN